MRRLSLLGAASAAALALATGAQAQTVSGGCGNGATCTSLSVLPQSATYTVGPGGQYATLTAAMAALNNQVYVNGSNVIHQLQDGVINEPGALSWFSPQNRQITVVGLHSYSFTLTSIQSCTGSAGAWSCVLNLSAAPTGAAVGDYFTIPAPTGGTNPGYLAGVWPVTAISGSQVTVTVTSRAAAAPSGAVTGTITDNKSTLKFAGTDGFDIWDGAAVANLRNLNIVGDGTSHRGIDLEDVGRLNVDGVLSVAGFGSNNVLANYNSELNVNLGGVLAASSSGSAGIEAITGAWIDVNGSLVSTGNTGQGIASFGGGVNGTNIVASGNGSDGILATQDGIVTSSSSTNVTGNLGRGLNSGSNGIFSLSGVTSANNTTADLTSYNVGSLSIGGTTSTYPMLAPAGANGQLNLRYADNSGNAPILVRSVNLSIVSSSASTLTTVCHIGGGANYVFTGTTATWTLATVANGILGPCYLKNRGSGAITINTAASGNDIYSTSAVNTLTLAAGASMTLFDDGTYFNVQ